MRRLNAVVVSGGIVATLLAVGCGEGEPISGPDIPLQAKPAGAGLKVTPPMLNFTGVGETVTLTASSSASPISVAVSNPACVSVTPKSGQPKQSKFTVTATAAGNCTLTVTDGAVGNVQVPVTVASPVVFGSTLAAGLFHTCGLDASGAAWCWGINSFGQLGNGSNISTVTANPTPLAVGGGLTFASLTAGFNHTCGLTPAGAAYCWGANYAGQLGNPINSGLLQVGSVTPVAVDGNLTFTTLEAGNDFNCGLTSQGVMYCWGSNSLGQLANTTNNITSLPNPTPVPVEGLTFTAFVAGATHTCGVAAAGVVYCWGNNSDAQLGNANAVGEGNVPQPTPTIVQDVPPLVSLVATNHTCGLTAAGAAWCWGSNHTGQLGVETPEVRHPTPVAAAEGFSFVSLGVGGGHTCGLTSGGTAYCWGSNLSGQLGTTTNFGTSTVSLSPIAVEGLSLVALALNAAHSCGLTAAGQAWCWGANANGQIGSTTNNGSQIGVPTPGTVLGGIIFATP